MNNLQAIADDLPKLVEQARWAYTHGWWRTGRGLDKEVGRSLSMSEDDALAAAPLYDIDIADHRSRVAYQHAVRCVRRADVLLASLVTGPQIPLAHLTPYSNPDELAHAAHVVEARCYRVTSSKHRRVVAVRSSIDRAIRGLSKALDAGPADGIAHAEKMCVTCRIRPQAEREKPDGTWRAHKGGECSVCAQWRTRNGSSRPAAKLDGNWLSEAKAAQARRRARGEDFGAA